MDENLFGLYHKDKELVVRIINVVAKVAVSIRIRNDQDHPLEFRQPNCSVHSFEAVIGNRKLKGICKTKDDATNLYDDALARGGGGILMEQTDKEIFTMSIGNLSPKENCTVTVEYVTTLTMVTPSDIENTKMLPAALKLALPVTRSTIKSDKEKSLIQGLDVNANITMPDSIAQLIVKNYSKANINISNNTAQVSYSHLTDSAGKDFTIIIQMSEPFTPKTTLEIMNNQYASLQLSLSPKFNSENEILCDMVFLVDRSGSMSGKNIDEAKNALQIFIRSLPEGSLFNIVSFGSNFSTLFPSSRVLDDETLTIATNHILGMSADMGGTQFKKPLKYIFESPCDPKFPRQLFMLTDGEATDPHEEILDLVKNSAGLVRVYTLGIGSGSDRKLLINMSKKGHGETAFIDKNDRVEKVVLQQLKRAMTPSLRNVQIDWKDWKDVFEQTPEVIPPVWNGKLLNVYGFTEKLQELNRVGDIEISASDGVSEHKTVVTINGNNKVENNGVITLLAASSKISDMEVKNKDKKEIEDFALKFNIVSKYTSFVAIEERDESIENSMEKVEVNVTNKPKGFFSNLISKVKKPKAASSTTMTFCGGYDTCNIDTCFTSDLSSTTSSSQDFSGFTYVPSGSKTASSGIDNFELLSVIGKGSFSKIMRTRDKVTGEIRTLSVFNKSSQPNISSKIQNFQQLSHPFFSSILSSFESDTKIYVISELYPGGELFFHLQKHKNFDLITTKFYASQILLLCEYLLQKGVQNPPLVPEQMLLGYDGYLALLPLNSSELDVNYVAPEVLGGGTFTDKSLSFVLGVFIYEMLVGLPPFYDQMKGVDYTKELKFPKLSEDSVNFLKQLLEIDPTKRIDLATCKAHSWWSGINWDDILDKKVTAPIVPNFKSQTDTGLIDSVFCSSDVPEDNTAVDANLFAGFTFTNDSSSSTSTTNCSAPSTTYTAPVATSTTYKVPSAPPKQPFDRLILLQKVSGAFELTQDLADIVKQDLASLQKSCPEPGQETSWATAIAIRQFETTFKDRLDESQFLVSKAKKFLSKQNKQDMIIKN